MAELYNKFYGFKEAPFNITPDPRFLYLSEKHRDALNHLLFGIQQRKGFIQLTGEVGAGKTTLCRALLGKLGENYKTALILNPCLTETQLLQAIVKEFGLEAEEQSRVGYLETLNKFLLEQVAEGNDVVLIIDEAQDLTTELLEQVRLLSNLETDDRKLLQIVLMGQPELRDKLNHRSLRQLRQRITVRYHLRPLTRHESEQYIHHRIQVCGGNGLPAFNNWAMRKVFRYSRGIPRLINAVCDKTLLCGFVEGTDRFCARHVRRAIRELEGNFA
ncbi:MAG: AAA family ATPase [Phycisphaerae bacterium]|nr:AAA family ATPase [Phycisphaerae bacterium]